MLCSLCWHGVNVSEIWDYLEIINGQPVHKRAWENLVNSVCNRFEDISELYSLGFQRPISILINDELSKFNAVYKWDGTTIVHFADQSSIAHFVLVWS